MPMGWASWWKPSMNRLRTFSWMNVWYVMSCFHASNCSAVGSSPWISR